MSIIVRLYYLGLNEVICFHVSYDIFGYDLQILSVFLTTY